MSRHYQKCLYCGAKLDLRRYATKVPDVDDEDAWQHEAEFHHDGCEWVLTRAHRYGSYPTGLDVTP